eukprot:982485-Prymnesium_polylepis.1
MAATLAIRLIPGSQDRWLARLLGRGQRGGHPNRVDHQRPKWLQCTKLSPGLPGCQQRLPAGCQQ